MSDVADSFGAMPLTGWLVLRTILSCMHGYHMLIHVQSSLVLSLGEHVLHSANVWVIQHVLQHLPSAVVPSGFM